MKRRAMAPNGTLLEAPEDVRATIMQEGDAAKAVDWDKLIDDEPNGLLQRRELLAPMLPLMPSTVTWSTGTL